MGNRAQFLESSDFWNEKNIEIEGYEIYTRIKIEIYLEEKMWFLNQVLYERIRIEDLNTLYEHTLLNVLLCARHSISAYWYIISDPITSPFH